MLQNAVHIEVGVSCLCYQDKLDNWESSLLQGKIGDVQCEVFGLVVVAVVSVLTEMLVHLEKAAPETARATAMAPTT